MTDVAHLEQRLYRLLPAHYRKRDADGGQLLRRVLAIIDDELRVVEDDIATLYDNWFIETCEPWVVPYLGDLLGAGDLGYVTFSDLRPRALVARVFEYRHRRGTAAGLEAVIRDVLGWTARVLEYDDRTRRHIEPASGHGRKERLTVLFDREPAEAMAIDVERPWYGPGIRPVDGDLGLFLQRFPRQTLRRAEAYPLDGSRGRYTVHPLGHDTPLYCRPGLHGGPRRRTAADVSGRLTAHDLGDHTTGTYGPEGSLQLYRNTNPIDMSDIACADLSDWRQDDRTILVDPERGRISLPAGDSMRSLLVDHTVAFGRRMAAGGYPRTPRSETEGGDIDFRCTVDRVTSAAPAPGPDAATEPTVRSIEPGGPAVRSIEPGGPAVRSIGAALDLWRDAGHPSGVIRIADSCRHSVRARQIRIPPGRRLVIEAADGARPVLYTGARGDRAPLRVDADGADEPGQLVIDGVVIDGTVAISGSGHLGLELHHCTVLAPRPADGDAPPSPALGASLQVEGEPRELAITLSSSLVGPIVAPAAGVTLHIIDSIVINATRATVTGTGLLAAVAGSPDRSEPGPETTLEQSTVLGPIHVRAMVRASDSLLLDPVRVEQRQIGVMHHCHLPLPSPDRDGPSRPPARLHCIPAGVEDSDIEPVLLSSEYGDPAFLQLAQRSDRHIRMGAEDSGEMGAFHDARLARREAFLHKILADYVPLGLTVDIFYID